MRLNNNNSYLKVNLIFITLIGLLFVYSFLFPYLPVKIPSSCNEVQDVYCKSKGLSRAYAEIVRFNFVKARMYNQFSLRTFAFFIYGFLSRVIYSIAFIQTKIKIIIYLDALFSTILFLICFSVLLWNIVDDVKIFRRK